MLAATAALASASFASELWQLYLGQGVLMGYASASLGGVLSATLLGRWFPPHRLGVGLAVRGRPPASAP